jgi:hypothetical protein
MTKKIEGFANLEEGENGKVKVSFEPGCFDGFEGTQEELDELVAQIHQMFESGEAMENAIVLSEEDFDDLPDEVKEKLSEELSGHSTRTLQ